METWTRTTDICPLCGHPCKVDWTSQTNTHHGRRRLLLSAIALACTHLCHVDPDQLNSAFPDRADC